MSVSHWTAQEIADVVYRSFSESTSPLEALEMIARYRAGLSEKEEETLLKMIAQYRASLASSIE